MFLAIWAIAFITLMLSVVILHWAYRTLGSDLGLNSWTKEVLLALFASVCQAGVFWAIASLGAMPGYYHYAFGAMIVLLCYRAGHLKDMGNIEPLIITVVQRMLFFVGMIVLSQIRC